MEPKRVQSRVDHLYFKTFGITLLIIAARGWQRFVYSDIWAEDGRDFLAQGLAHGMGSLWLTVDGSYHTIQRLILLSAMQILPLSWLPSLICGSCFLVFAAIVSLIVSRNYEWLIPSTGARFLTACLLCMAPGLGEMLGNLANLNWILFCGLALVGLKNPDKPLTFGELLFTLFTVASIGTFVLLIPLFIWRLGVLIYQKRPTRDILPGILQLVILFSSTSWLIFHKGDRPPQIPIRSFSELFFAYFGHILRHGVFQPWVGDRLSVLLFGKYPKIVLLVSFAFPLFILKWALAHFRETRCQAILIFFGGLSLWTILCILARPAALNSIQGPLAGGSFFHRYSFPMAVGGVLLWMTVIHPLKLLKNRKPTLALVFVVFSLFQAKHRFFVSPYGPERLWKDTVPMLENFLKHRGPEEVVAPIYPQGWQIRLNSRTAQ